MKTPAAQAAALIRKELKAAFPNEPFRVRSRNFSMGDAVDIYIGAYVGRGTFDQFNREFTEPTESMVKAREIVGKYQYGRFDGMTDSYEYTNSRKDIPQAKYVHVHPFKQA